MKSLKFNLLIIIFICNLSFGQHTDDYVPGTAGHSGFGKTPEEAYTPEIRENMKKLWHDKFGMFIHFGPYAQLEGMWDGKSVSPAWIMHNVPIPIADYEQLAARKFNPSRFNAHEWIEVARKAGMGFMVVTSKHHDGFAMFKSGHPYNIVDFTDFKRDMIGELADACKEEAFSLGLYYSQSQDWHEEGGVGNSWDFPANLPDAKFADYFNSKAVPQVKELAKNYGDLFMFWFDTPTSFITDAQCKQLIDILTEDQPGALVNSRLGRGYGHFDVSIDHGATPGVYRSRWVSDLKVPWQTHSTVSGAWGYAKGISTKDRSDEYTTFIYDLCNIVSHGGVYLLNVDPAPDGTIPQAQVNSLTAIGDWLKINGESIYDADPSPFLFPPFAITSKPGKLYLHIRETHAGSVYLPGLLTRVRKAYCLADKSQSPLKFRQRKGELKIDFPPGLIQPHVTVIAIDLEEQEARVADETIVPGKLGTIDLPVAKCQFEILRIGYKYKQQVTFRWGESRNQGLIWKVRIDKPLGSYKLFAEQTGDDIYQYDVFIKDQSLTVSAKGPSGMSITEVPGEFSITEPGTYTIIARPKVTGKFRDYQLKGLTLVPVP